MPQEQSVIIATHSAFIFQCPWFIKRQCAGSPTPHPPLPPPTPSLSMISAALRRSVQIESGMDEDVATWVGALCSSDYRLHSREDRQTGQRRFGSVSWLRPNLSKPPSSCLVLWLLHSHTLHCARLTFLPSWHGHAYALTHLCRWLTPYAAFSPCPSFINPLCGWPGGHECEIVSFAAALDKELEHR